MLRRIVLMLTAALVVFSGSAIAADAPDTSVTGYLADVRPSGLFAPEIPSPVGIRIVIAQDLQRGTVANSFGALDFRSVVRTVIQQFTMSDETLLKRIRPRPRVERDDRMSNTDN